MIALTCEVHTNNTAYTWRKNQSVDARFARSVDAEFSRKGNKFILNNAVKSIIKKSKRDHMELYTKRKEVK